MSIGIRKTISRVNKRLQEYFKTVDEETDIPERNANVKSCYKYLLTIRDIWMKPLNNWRGVITSGVD